MKRLILSLGALALLTLFVGCGDSSAPGNGANAPAKAEEIEKRRQEERDRSGGTAGAPGGGTAGAPAR